MEKLEDLNRKLTENEGRRQQQQKLRSSLGRISARLKEEEKRLSGLRKAARVHDRDVARLECMGFRRFLHMFLGDLQVVLKEEHNRLVDTKLELDAGRKAISDLKQRQKALAEKLKGFKNTEGEVQQLQADKAKVLAEQGVPQAEETADISAELGRLAARIREYNEALRSGQSLNRTVREGIKALNILQWKTVWGQPAGVEQAMVLHTIKGTRQRIAKFVDRFRTESGDVAVRLPDEFDMERIAAHVAAPNPYRYHQVTPGARAKVMNKNLKSMVPCLEGLLQLLERERSELRAELRRLSGKRTALIRDITAS